MGETAFELDRDPDEEGVGISRLLMVRVVTIVGRARVFEGGIEAEEEGVSGREFDGTREEEADVEGGIEVEEEVSGRELDGTREEEPDLEGGIEVEEDVSGRELDGTREEEPDLEGGIEVEEEVSGRELDGTWEEEPDLEESSIGVQVIGREGMGNGVR